MQQMRDEYNLVTISYKADHTSESVINENPNDLWCLEATLDRDKKGIRP